MNDFLISRMNADDIPALEDLEKICFSSPWSANSFIEELNNTNARFFVCRYNEKVIGYIGSFFVCNEASITNIAVFPQYRRNGVACALINKLIETAKNEKISSIFLEVRKSNENAQKLYKKCGFSTCGERKNFYTLPSEDAIIFRLNIFEGE